MAAAATVKRSSPLKHSSRSVAAFSPIVSAPIRVGEDEPPPSWDPVPSKQSYPKAKMFRTKTFSLFEALGQFYDGHIPEGTYNYTSAQSRSNDIVAVDSGDELGNKDVTDTNLEEAVPLEICDELGNREGDASGERHSKMPQRRVAVVTRTTEEKEPKRQKKDIARLMEKYLDLETNQAQEEKMAREKEERMAREREEQEAKEREASQVNDCSIKKCISVLSKLEVTKEEKAKAYSVFKDLDNRQIFLSACEDDTETDYFG